MHALVDASGAVVESYTYDAWGVTVIRNAGGAAIPASAYGNRFMFQGREYSAATGLYNFRARWYSPELGRWLSPDPIGLEGGLNLYEFCANNPVNFRDPEGLITVVLYDGNEDDNGWERTVTAHIESDNSYNVGQDNSLRGAIQYMNNLVQSGSIIDRIIILDHGYVTSPASEDSSLGQQYGDKELLALPCGDPQDYINFGALLSENGYIDLWGCYVGSNMARVQDYANAFGRKVTATLGASRYIEVNGIVWGAYQIPFSRRSRYPEFK